MPFMLGRPLSSYSKVQRVAGWAIRNRGFQLRSEAVRSKQYLDIGCGHKTHAHVINLDWQWHPEIDLCWDVAKLGLPFSDNSLQGIYSEHCLEHHRPDTSLFLLSECLRTLKPGGRIRLVLPDAEKYLRIYCEAREKKDKAHQPFPYPADAIWKDIASPLLAVNRIFYQDRESPYGHCFMFDRHLLKAFLSKVGFVTIRSCGYRSGKDPNLFLDSEERWAESFAMEAQRP